MCPPERGAVVAMPQVGGLHHRYEMRLCLLEFSNAYYESLARTAVTMLHVSMARGGWGTHVAMFGRRGVSSFVSAPVENARWHSHQRIQAIADHYSVFSEAGLCKLSVSH